MVLRDKVFIIWPCMLLILLLRKPAYALEEAINGLANPIIKGDAKLIIEAFHSRMLNNNEFHLILLDIDSKTLIY
jgi:hypothetical protein